MSFAVGQKQRKQEASWAASLALLRAVSWPWVISIPVKFAPVPQPQRKGNAEVLGVLDGNGAWQQAHV